jgi:ribosomal protein S18 acetylase RimI-like enzyme
MLFVASDNARAVSLYRSLGFREQRVDRAYERDVP